MEKNNEIQLNTDYSLIPARNESEGISGLSSKKADQHQLRNVIKMAVAKAYYSTGRPLEVKDGTFIIDELKSEILRAFPGIRIEEIGLAIHKGAMGEFGIVYNLSLATFVSFIRSYLNSSERVEAAKKFIKERNFIDQVSKPNDEEMKKAKVQIALNAYEQFKEKGIYKDYGNYVFNSLVDFGAVALSDEQKDEIWKMARYAVLGYYMQPGRNIDERNENKRILDELRANKEHQLFYDEAKKIALQYLFKDFQDMDIDLKELIQQ